MSTRQQFMLKTSDGQQLCVKTFGSASLPALVLVHGYPDNQTVWTDMIAHLESQFYVLSYDVRGAGQSSRPAKLQDYRLPRLGKDLQEVCDHVLGDRPFHLAAHDWGSIQSWEAVTEPSMHGRILSFSSISGPCLDHASFWFRDKAKGSPAQLFKQLSKSWYIAAFHLPVLAPTVWKWIGTDFWSKVIAKLEHTADLPVNEQISQDGEYGIALYRANFIPRLLQPRQRYAQCPVQAIVLQYDRFVDPLLIDEYPKWVADFSRVTVAANHWAILSQAEQVAQHVADYALKHHV